MENNKLLLLGLLRRQEMHGYQLYEFIERDLAVCTDLKKPTAYYLLNQMAQDGWVVEQTQQEGNRPPRRVYHLTGLGEQAFQRLLAENLGSSTQVYFPDDIGLAYLDVLEPAQAVLLLNHRRDVLESALNEITSIPLHSGSVQLVIEHRRRHLISELEWLDEVLHSLLATDH